MQVTETARDGLKRTLKVVVNQQELGERFSVRLDELKDRVQLKGFRKGKVPVPHLKKVYGKSLMQEVLEQTLLRPVRRRSKSATSALRISRNSSLSMPTKTPSSGSSMVKLILPIR